MISLVLAFTVGMLFATGVYMILRRGQIKLILGLALLSHGVNLLLFGSGILTRGRPPIFLDKANYLADLTEGSLADPLPQALILTAIVISFGITAFVIVLINRRHTIANTDVVHGELAALLRENDPFAEPDQLRGRPSQETLHYDWLAYEVDEVYDRDVLAGGASPGLASESDESAAMAKEEY